MAWVINIIFLYNVKLKADSDRELIDNNRMHTKRGVKRGRRQESHGGPQHKRDPEQGYCRQIITRVRTSTLTPVTLIIFWT